MAGMRSYIKRWLESEVDVEAPFEEVAVQMVQVVAEARKSNGMTCSIKYNEDFPKVLGEVAPEVLREIRESRGNGT